MKAFVCLLAQKATCNEKVLEECDDHDIVLIDAVSDCIDDMARVYGSEFAQFFGPILNELIKYLGNERPSGDKIMAMGTLAEVTNAMKNSISPFVPVRKYF